MNTRTKIRLFIFLEILVWLLIIVLVVGTIRIYHSKKVGEYRTYRIFLQDVDGLIEGSSVRMMGVPIGYVKDISIVQDYVYVKFLITDKNVELPQGVIATVEFNGMAGSKSLELYPPDKVSVASGNMVVVKKTNRLGAALSLFDDMFAKFDSIVVRCNHFSGEVANIIPKTQTVSDNPIEDADSSVFFVSNLLDQLNSKRMNFVKLVKDMTSKLSR